MIERKHGILNFNNEELDEFLKGIFESATDESEVRRIYEHIETGLDVAATNQIFNIQK